VTVTASPPAVVALHGFTGSGAAFGDAVNGLLGADSTGHDSVGRTPGHGPTTTRSPDLPGHGTAEAYRQATCFEDVSAQLALDIAGRCGYGVDLVGYSMGGRLALHLACTQPGLVGRLVLISACPGIEDENKRSSRRFSDEQLAVSLETDGIEVFVEHWEALPLFAGIARLDAGVRSELDRQRIACDAAGLALALRCMGTGSQPWLGNWLAGLDLPVLLIAGSEDEKYATIARQMHDLIPRARLAIIDNSGHCPHLEQPQVVGAQLQAFLGPRRAPARPPRGSQQDPCTTEQRRARQ